MDGSGLLNGATNTIEQVAGLEPRLQRKAAEASASQGVNPMLVRTVLNISRDSLDYWNSLTCFFNKHWYPEPGSVTLPFCFFHITEFSIARKAERSQKRVIMYEPPGEQGKDDRKDPVRPGLMQTMTDNVVIQPKAYNISAVVPFLPFGRFCAERVDVAAMLDRALNSFSVQPDGLENKSIAFIKRQLASVIGPNGFVPNAREAMQRQGAFLDLDPAMFSGSDMVNVNSLEAMFNMGGHVEFKTWMGTDSVYGVITDYTIEKKAREDDVWRVRMTFEELPVLSLTPMKGRMTSKVIPWLRNAIDSYGRVALKGARVSAAMPYYQSLKE